jgi:hypothetical protein
MSERRGAGAVPVVLVPGAAGVRAGSTLATGPGKPMPSLAGRYLFGDYCDGKLHSMLVDGGRATYVTDLGLTVPTLDSFGVDRLGRVYVTATDGGVYRLDPA